MFDGLVRDVWSTVPPVRSIARVHDPVEGPQEAAAVLLCGIHVGQALPAAADAEADPADLAGPIHDALDDRVEPGDVAAAGENGDAFHDCTGHAARSEPDL